MRRMSDAGLKVLGWEEQMEDHIVFDHQTKYVGREKSQFVNGFVYRIHAKVTDAVRFAQAVQVGIGRGKAYGCGMTIFQPVLPEGE